MLASFILTLIYSFFASLLLSVLCLLFPPSSLSLSLSPAPFLSQGHTDELWGLDVHPSLEQFVTCGQDKQVHLWDTISHQPLWSKAIEVLNAPTASLCMHSTLIHPMMLMIHRIPMHASHTNTPHCNTPTASPYMHHTLIHHTTPQYIHRTAIYTLHPNTCIAPKYTNRIPIHASHTNTPHHNTSTALQYIHCTLIHYTAIHPLHCNIYTRP